MAMTPDHFQTLGAWAHQETKLIAFRPMTDERRVRHWKNTERIRSGYYGQMSKVVQQALNDQMQAVLDNISSVRNPREIPQAVDAATQRFSQIMEQAYRRIYRTIVPVFAERVLESMPKTRASPHHLKATGEEGREGIWMDASDRFITQNVGRLIREVNDNTRQAIREATQTAVRTGIVDGLGIEEIADRIQEQSEQAISRTRALRIARTETIRASNFASITAARSMGMNLKKEWIATPDDRVRATHWEANAQTVPLEQPFTVGGYKAMYPSDPSLPARESVNCRCTLAYDVRG